MDGKEDAEDAKDDWVENGSTSNWANDPNTSGSFGLWRAKQSRNEHRKWSKTRNVDKEERPYERWTMKRKSIEDGPAGDRYEWKAKNV